VDVFRGGGKAGREVGGHPVVCFNAAAGQRRVHSDPEIVKHSPVYVCDRCDTMKHAR